MLRLVQLNHVAEGRRIAIVDGESLLVLTNFRSCYDLAQTALDRRIAVERFAGSLETEGSLRYDDVYSARSDWQLLVPFDNPTEPSRCLVSGTGLTHISSAETRQKMHGESEQVTDSIRMYRWGVEAGRPPAGSVGVAPEWFYKGSSSILRAAGAALTIPAFAEDGGEEAEIAGVYMIDAAGQPRRVGLSMGNEFSDHKTERRNYLYLAHSKLRECSLGPELVIGADFNFVPGTVQIERGGKIIWCKHISSGEQCMSHSLANIEHHHFKYPAHRCAGDVHIHFLGADAFSFGSGIELKDGDTVQISFDGFGRPLRNPIRVDTQLQAIIAVAPL
jgi:hypothetical protein